MIDEALEQIVCTLKNFVSIAARNPNADSFIGQDVDMNNIEATFRRTSLETAVVGASLLEAEPDMFPCLVVICGSAFAFLKVSTSRFCLRCQLERGPCS